MAKSISAAFKAHLAGPQQTVATCCKVTWTDGTIRGFTDEAQDIVFGGVTYQSIYGYKASAIVTSSDLNVDNLEIQGPQRAPSVNDDEIHAGLWDFATISLFQVNFKDLTQGSLSLRDGWLGQVSLGRGDFKLELRGLMQAYTRSIGRTYTPGCQWNLGDANCTKDLTTGGLTVTGSFTGVNADGLTLYDTVRTEAGPAAGTAITGISNANPGIVTMTAPGTFFNGEAVSLSGIVGPSLLNRTTIIRSLTGSTWSLGIDTSDTAAYPAYVSGGLVTPLGGNSGFFDFGVITILTSASAGNVGLKREVKFYVPGQIALVEPFPYLLFAADTYQMTAGCDRIHTTCQTRFNNLVNFGGFPFVPGLDNIVQVGRHQ